MDSDILQLLFYAIPIGLFILISIGIWVASLWEKTRAGKQKKALDKSLSAYDRRSAIHKLDPELAKDRNVLIKITEDEKDQSFAREAALEMLPYEDAREVYRKWAQDGSSYAIRRLDAKQDADILLSLARDGNETVLERRLSDMEKDLLIREIVNDPDGNIDAQLAVIRYALSFSEDREALIQIAVQHPSHLCRRAALEKLPYPEERRAAALAQTAEYCEDTIYFLCEKIHRGIRLRSSGDGRESLTSQEIYMRVADAGWSAAALGRVLAKKMSPEDIRPNMDAIQTAIDEYNRDAEQYAADYKAEVKSYNSDVSYYNNRRNRRASGSSGTFDPNDPFSFSSSYLEGPVFDRFGKLKEKEEKLERGLGGFMLDHGDLPLAYLIHILRDNQSDIPRFVKQGVIMGLLDWLMDHRDHPEAAKLLETVVAVRADMIRSDSDLTFFELRVREDCAREDYAVLLADVLHCANPSVRCCDADELLRIAEAEVPGCMDMLRVCPLRIIDPANRRTLGFYQFRPYVRAMWTRFQPPKGEGKVLSRYHEVDDRTKPLSSGLHLSLFHDPYAVIPTIFHEYQHFKGDRNEASVFLKTQVFSIAFYKKFPEADAKSDGVFAQMTAMLGLPPATSKCSALNGTIERFYGKQVSEAEAKKRADDEIRALNDLVDEVNRAETWDPSVKFPRLDDGEDEKNRDLIRDIIIRFATVPKSITAEEFQEILDSKE